MIKIVALPLSHTTQNYMDRNMQALHQHRFTTKEYFSIGESETPLYTKTELINGVIYDMVPPGPNHSYTVGELAKQLIIALKNKVIRQEQPIQLLPSDAPQPDIAILRESPDRYRSAHPTAQDVIALIEVSDSTLSYDTGDKMKLYARAEIPLYFVVDISGKLIWQFSTPDKHSYENQEQCRQISIPELNISIDIQSII